MSNRIVLIILAIAGIAVFVLASQYNVLQMRAIKKTPQLLCDLSHPCHKTVSPKGVCAPGRSCSAS